ncbi:ribosome recycling factor [Candidatus Marinamargulisbacteria bacterium SCGC AG-439-L15]|nr:ribosome recycling factor [Candidatus Marinamargulisbacteria bacterium SCGC AG-439-L15]
MQEVEEKMQKTIDSIKSKLMTVRTGRANPDLLSRIVVDYYGTQVPLQQVANVTTMEGNSLLVNVFDNNAIKSVEKAIQMSDLNLNPQTDGGMIRLKLPELTEERRKDLVKIVKQQIEDGKVALRNIRRDYLDKLKKESDSTEDSLKDAQESIQKIIDKYSGLLETLGAEKESEITSI